MQGGEYRRRREERACDITRLTLYFQSFALIEHDYELQLKYKQVYIRN